MCSFQSSSINSLNNPIVWRSAGPHKSSSSHQSLRKSHLDVGLNTATVWNTQRGLEPLETKRLFIFNLSGCFISKRSLILGNNQSLSRWRDKSCWTDNKSSDCQEELRLRCKRRAERFRSNSGVSLNVAKHLSPLMSHWYVISSDLKQASVIYDQVWW